MIILNKEEINDNLINIKTDSILMLINVDNELVINIDANIKLLVLDFNLNANNLKITINQTNNSEVNYLHTFKTKNVYNFTYFVNMQGDNNINNVHIKGIATMDANLSVDGDILPNTKGNILNEDIRILNFGGKVLVKPMMHINAKDVLANHNTAISNIRDDELFYLNSKGISNIGAITLIEDGYLYGMFKEYPEFLELIQEG